MKYKVLAFDIDGTLTNSEKKITPRTRAAIIKAQEQGCVAAIASGRPRPGVKGYADELGLREHGGYILALNGGLLERYSDGRIIRQSVIPREYYGEICALARENNVNILTYDGDTVVSENLDDEYLETEVRINGLGQKRVDNLCEYLTYEVPKFLMLGDGDRLARIEPKIYERLHERMDVYRSEPFFLEILPKNINKASALEELLGFVGAGRDELMAFGDGYNDISMLEFAGMGVAMGNASVEIKRHADIVARGNDEDGIAEILEKYVLN
ncbi:MAG: Cof-type HAD-IIB family hydrolase [Butyrivibrio sp.]|nr:Cof-type HAD-IIB family hydrolase [Butyrivibrio sp.]